ncbi:hypothetical protein BDY19DRAFT_991679 [Irpex rosettiformis]|uniref:Uncharacterized protein n=1 Tax=Irpex rosettiformis TaxID=378272 RepID=A0ACB8UA22_9APHY|nr:hypothetical protein BDY19DRAFT_991679 [Irpex rosettiformis]
MSIDSQIIQDLIPGTGALGSAPQHHDFKRTVLHPAPKKFTVEVLPPKKFGSGYCYGLHVLPIFDGGSATSSASSTKSGESTSEYEIWRRWEDCLWFQDMLETEYKLMARLKRIRLQQGKGIKKNGVYLQSGGAASFESLPPGPDANDIAKDVHEILPKLTKKGTIFKASQATIEQRGREFSALIQAFFEEDVPSLVKELRENRIIRDFFGYWRRDKDHERKAQEVETRSNRLSRMSIASSAFSMYFSSSNISLQLPGAFSDMPPSPAIPESIKGKGKAVDRGDSRIPATAPVGMSFTVSETGAFVPTSPISDDDNYFASSSGPRSAPLRPSSARRSRNSKAERTFLGYGFDSASESEDNAIVFVPDGPLSSSLTADMRRPRNLEALPEEQELDPGTADMTLASCEHVPPPVRRPRNYSCPDPHVRNGLVFVTPPQGPRSTPESLDDISTIDDISGDVDRPSPDTSLTNSTSSRHTSAALSSFSGELSRRSSWRTSVDSATSVPARSSIQDSSLDLDDVLCGSPSHTRAPWSQGNPEQSYGRRMSIMTMNSIVSNASVDAVLPRRTLEPIPQEGALRRSMSTGSRYSRQSMPTSLAGTNREGNNNGDEILEDELLDAYFYDPSLRLSGVPSIESLSTSAADRDSALLARFPQPPQSAPAQRLSKISSSPSSPRPSITSLGSGTPGSPSFYGDSVTIKTVLQDSIVLVRAHTSTPLHDLRVKIREKFASQEGITLTDNFTIGFNPAVTAADDRSKTLSAKGRPRSHSTSAVTQLGGQPRLRFLIYEEDWQQAAISSPGKLTLHIFDRF